MKIIGIILAVSLVIGMIAGIGYVAVSGFQLLSVQWFSLNDDWKAILIIVAALVIFCTLMGALFIRLSIKQYGLMGIGKMTAYNHFMDWYSRLQNTGNEIPDPGRLKTLSNQMKLWGSKQVSRQTGMLYELLIKESSDSDEILKKAEHVYIEIRRDLGLRGAIKDNPIV